MTASALTTSHLSQIVDSSSTADQFVSELNQLAQDLQSGNLAAAQQDYVTLSQVGDGTATVSPGTTTGGITTSQLSDTASSSASAGKFVAEFNQLGTDLQNSNVNDSQQDILALDATAHDAASPGNSFTTSFVSNTIATKPASQTEIAELVDTVVQAMELRENSIVSSVMAELAYLSPSSEGTAALANAGASLSENNTISSAAETYGTSATGNLPDGLNPQSGSHSVSLLNEIA